MKRIFSVLMVALILVSALVMTFDVQPAKAVGTIYIWGDGSIDPLDAPIQTFDNITYTLTDNITSSTDGIVVERDNIILDGVGYVLQGSQTSPYSGINLEGSNITIKSIQIKEFYNGVNLRHSSHDTISRNNITANTGNGIILDSSLNCSISSNNIANNAHGIYLSSSPNCNISGNNITANNLDGIGLSGSSNCRVSSNNIANNGFGISLGSSLNCNISSNNITANSGYGIFLGSSPNCNISGNNITNNPYGIYLYSSSNCRIYHNNFIDNTRQVYIYLPYYANVWDDDYPSGGNYWSDYTGVDLYSGPDQNMDRSDFRGDTPYIIDSDNIDHYPLTIPYETQPPTIIVLSPENTTYAVDTDIQLTFTLDEPVNWIGYSLSDQAIVTITGNITLPTLLIGGHHVTVYANDTFNNVGSSTVYFTVLDMTNPIANAGSDRTVNEDVSTTLDGSASTDNVGITGYTWTFTDVTLKTLTGDKPTYPFSNPGDYTITLNVTDAAGNWATDTVVITVLDVTNPVANAGQDQTVNVGETVSFDAGGSTDNVGIVSYEWGFGDGATGTGKTITHEYTDAGTYTVTLTVEDAAGNQATNTVVVMVNAAEAFPWWIVAAAGIVVVGIVVAALFLWKRRKKTWQDSHIEGIRRPPVADASPTRSEIKSCAWQFAKQSS